MLQNQINQPTGQLRSRVASFLAVPVRCTASRLSEAAPRHLDATDEGTASNRQKGLRYQSLLQTESVKSLALVSPQGRNRIL